MEGCLGCSDVQAVEAHDPGTGGQKPGAEREIATLTRAAALESRPYAGSSALKADSLSEAGRGRFLPLSRVEDSGEPSAASAPQDNMPRC